jgi:DNA-binding FadR family transcriptional regulator
MSEPHASSLPPEPVRGEDADPAYRPGYEIAAERILEYVTANHLQAGDRLPTERQLSELIDTSRSVTREAVKILSAMGRLRVRKGAGIYVGRPGNLLTDEAFGLFMPADLQQVHMLFEFRETLECHTARMAAARATPQQLHELQSLSAELSAAARADDRETFNRADERYHRLLARAANNVFQERTISRIQELTWQVATIGLAGAGSNSLLDGAAEHAAITAAISAGDGDGAERAMAAHIEHTLEDYQDTIRRRLFSEPDAQGS